MSGALAEIKGWTAMAFVFVLAGTACGSSSVHAAARPRPSPVALDCRGASEADPTYAPPPGVQFVNLTVDGKLRDYRVFRPSTLDQSKPVPLVVALHGSPIDAAAFEDVVNFDAEATAGHFMTAWPNGCGGYWSYAERGPMHDDEDFIRQMIARLEADYSIDRSRVYAVGASAGSWVVYRLACDMAEVFAAVGSDAGTMRLSDPCVPSRPVSVLEMHGTNDNQHPWQGGGPHGAFPVDDVMKRWVTLDQCGGQPTMTHAGITTTSLWSHCSRGVEVRLDAVAGGLHQWFGSQLAPVPGEPDFNTTVWSFFLSVPTRS